LDEQVGPEKLRQQAVEMILESSSLTDDLTDEEARPLIAWGLDQAEAAADAVVASQRISVSHLLPALPVADLRAALAGRVGPVRHVMKAISALTAARRDLSSQEMVGELGNICMMAGELPAQALVTITDTGLTELGARQAGLDNAAFVQALLALLEPGHGHQEQETEQRTETGVTNGG
jgi:hypothetical protein